MDSNSEIFKDDVTALSSVAYDLTVGTKETFYGMLFISKFLTL